VGDDLFFFSLDSLDTLNGDFGVERDRGDLGLCGRLRGGLRGGLRVSDLYLPDSIKNV